MTHSTLGTTHRRPNRPKELNFSEEDSQTGNKMVVYNVRHTCYIRFCTFRCTIMDSKQNKKVRHCEEVQDTRHLRTRTRAHPTVLYKILPPPPPPRSRPHESKHPSCGPTHTKHGQQALDAWHQAWHCTTTAERLGELLLWSWIYTAGKKW